MSQAQSPVVVRRDTITLPTYSPEPPTRHPMFLEKRVYQGSSGRVYPLPFYDRIAESPQPRAWDAVHLENEYLYVMILPELGGRIQVLRDKTNNYDAVYRQDVIKPALVGLAGPWVSGGIEFNWPQHHRPATFMPVAVAIEHSDDGAVTVWCSDHDPLSRLRGAHGICLRPGQSVLELKVRAYNRTTDVQTFLWWANAATRVHEHYESFFPPDVTSIADHAKRATSTFPLCTGRYYGVDYAERARSGVPADEQPARYQPLAEVPPNNLAWYANIPVPTSYMALGSRDDFFGGYDHRAAAGLLHVANRHIAPGKKQWTWGNHDFGYAWDRNLTEPDSTGEYPPYIELMAGVYTDNQPDFSYLHPGETKTWSQYWYPFREIGPTRQANRDAALSLTCVGRTIRLGVAVTQRRPQTTVTLFARGREIGRWQRDLAPDRPLLVEIKSRRTLQLADLSAVVSDENGRELLHHVERSPRPAAAPMPATEPPAPKDISSNDELYLVGLHLEQYRHATRMPDLYWREALRRDSGDARCHLAMGRWHLRRGEFAAAESHLRASIERLTRRNPNPYDGEPFYQLGICLRHLERTDEAYDALYKATWNQAWAGTAHHALAEIDAARQSWPQAREHLERALRLNSDNLRARALLAVVLRQLGNERGADEALRLNHELDPLDPWTQYLRGAQFPGDTQTRLDVAHDCARAGLLDDAIALLQSATPEPGSGTAPLIAYTLAWLYSKRGDKRSAGQQRKAARNAPLDYCFPARLEEIHILTDAIEADPGDPRAPYYLGNLLYDRRRHREAIALWEKSARLDSSCAIVWRNLGIGYFNIHRSPARARTAYERAVRADPNDARLRYERDQLWKRMGIAPSRRLKSLETRRDLVELRDDLAIEYCALLNLAGRHSDALQVMSSRRFQPWEGGEGQVLAQYTSAQLGLGHAALAAGDANTARSHFEAALNPPPNLGEVRHFLANPSPVLLAVGDACAALGDRAAARAHWQQAANFRGDFQGMKEREFSETSFFSALAWQRLGRAERSRRMLRELGNFARALAKKPAGIDYFATSLPTMLLFDDDLSARQRTSALFMEAQARLGLGERGAARRLLHQVLTRDPSHALAHELMVPTFASNPKSKPKSRSDRKTS